MGAGILLILILLVLAAIYLFFGRWLARCMGVDENRRTPVARRSGAGRPGAGVGPLLSSHAISIIGLSPLTATLASTLFGFVPALLWLVISGLWFSVSGQLSVLLATVRAGGRGIDEVMQKHLGGKGRFALVGLSVFLLLMMMAMLLSQTAAHLSAGPLVVQPSAYLADEAGYLAAQAEDPSTTIMDYVDQGRYQAARTLSSTIAQARHRAGTGLLVVMAVSGLFGYLWHRKEKWGWWMAPALGLLCAGIIYLLRDFSLPLSQTYWLLLLTGYALVCSLLEVKSLSLPRDMLAGLLGALVLILSMAGLILGNPPIEMPALRGWTVPVGEQTRTLLPTLCTTLACGALMGVHTLFQTQGVAQMIENERHAKPVVLGGMTLAVLTGIVVILGGAAAWLPSAPAVGSQAYEQWTLGRLALSIQQLRIPEGGAYLLLSLGLVVAAVCGMDAVSRTARSLLQRLFGEYRESALGRLLSTRWVMAVFTCAVAFVMTIAGYEQLWSLTAPASLTLAACALWLGTAWLWSNRRASWMVGIPAAVVSFVNLWAVADALWRVLQRLLTGQGAPAGAVIQSVLLLVMVALMAYIMRATYKAMQGKAPVEA